MNGKGTNRGPVTLRSRALKGGGESLYLDVNLGHGRRHCEFLRLYIVPENTKEDREANKETWRMANAIATRRTLDIQSGLHCLPRKSRDFLQVYDECMERRSISEHTRNLWVSVRKWIERYADAERVPTKTDCIDAQWLDGLSCYMLREGLRPQSAIQYMSKVFAAVRYAAQLGGVRLSVIAEAQRVKGECAERCYLTMEELRRLAATPCENQVVRRAFLFSCLTGMRCSDISALTWGHVSPADGEGMRRITFAQVKTRRREYLDVSPEACAQMGERAGLDDHVFAGLGDSDTVNRWLAGWVAAAGIGKHITFHCGRHTFATLMLTLGVDIFTVSKLLGHRSLSSTLVYARIVDEKKRAAVRLIPSL